MRNPHRWANETIILLVMQTADNYFHLKRRRPWFFPFAPVLASKPGTECRHPTWFPVGNDFGRRLARRAGGAASNVISEVTVGAPITAHILGRLLVRADAGRRRRSTSGTGSEGYANMIVCDGSQIPENLGVNPALSITAFAERAMSFVPPKTTVRTLIAEKMWGLDGLLTRSSGPSRSPPTPAA